jgi:hypothetical protein
MLTDQPFEKFGLSDRHPDWLLYDYTKLHNRAGWIRENYYVTFSYDGTNLREALRVLEAGNNVAVVFYDNTPGAKCGKAAHRQQLPKTWQGYPVIDGTITDWRPEDPRGVVVGLKLLAKTWQSRNDEDSLAYAMGSV